MFRNLIIAVVVVLVSSIASTAMAGSLELTTFDESRIVNAACENQNGASVTWKNPETGAFFFCSAVESAKRDQNNLLRQTRVMEVSAMTVNGLEEAVRVLVTFERAARGKTNVTVAFMD